MSASRSTVSVVIPLFKEAGSLTELLARLDGVASKEPEQFDLIFVDDGSPDATWETLTRLTQQRANCTTIRLSRNFGKETALSAGIDAAKGDAVVLMDGDLQHPPELISAFLKQWRAGHDVVYGVQQGREADGALRRSLSRLFYQVFNSLSETQLTPDAGDFRLMSRRVVDAIGLLRERSRFMKGIYSWVGFDGVGVPFDAPPRKHGQSSFSLARLFKFAFGGLMSFSTVPLKLGIIMGVIAAALALLLGLVGLYVGRVLEEVKGRPLYIVRDQSPPRSGSSN